MRNNPRTSDPFETHEQWRGRMIEETNRFIEWALAHPDQVPQIPRHPVGSSPFTDRAKKIFWSLFLHDA